jgi:hypothetical protein
MLWVAKSKSPVPGGGGFAHYAVVSLYGLGVYLEKSHRQALDLLSEMPHILGEIALESADFPEYSTLVKWLDEIFDRTLGSAAAPFGVHNSEICAHKNHFEISDAAARPERFPRERRDVLRPGKCQQALLPADEL